MNLEENLKEKFAEKIELIKLNDEITIEVNPSEILSVFKELRDCKNLGFEQLIDLCGVDYLDYGLSEWNTNDSTISGFSRGVDSSENESKLDKPRFAVVYHLLSLKHNWRLRVKTYLEESDLILDSVVSIYNSANWYEREAYDLFGIIFNNHPDLRRILTDYGFVGHPFRKDFPLSGRVEVRYDATEGRVVNELVDIEPRVLVPKVIREDNRYIAEEEE